MQLLDGCQRMGATEKTVSCPFGDTAVAPQSNSPLPVPELWSVLDCHRGSPGLGGSYQETPVQVRFRAWAPAV